MGNHRVLSIRELADLRTDTMAISMATPIDDPQADQLPQDPTKQDVSFDVITLRGRGQARDGALQLEQAA